MSYRLELRSIYLTQIRVQEFISHIDQSSGVYISHRLEFRSIYLTQIRVQEYISHIDQSSGVYNSHQIRVQGYISNLDQSSGDILHQIRVQGYIFITKIMQRVSIRLLATLHGVQLPVHGVTQPNSLQLYRFNSVKEIKSYFIPLYIYTYKTNKEKEEERGE